MTREQMPSFTEETFTAFQDPMWLAIAAFAFLVFVLAGCRVFSKAGYHPLVGLLFFVPLVNLGVFLFLAFSRWPIQRELRELRGVHESARRVDQQRLRRAG